MDKLSAPIDLLQVRRLFANPSDIEGSAFLRREIADRMREKLDLVRIEAKFVADLGCGLGEELPYLQQRFGDAKVVGIDGSINLLKLGMQQQKSAGAGVAKFLQKILPIDWAGSSPYEIICSDFARLPLAANSVDVIWSNLALHWHPMPDLVLADWRRALKVGGLCMFSCFGPDTMMELRAAFAEVDQDPHILPFVDMHDFGDMSVHAGLATPVMDMEKITIRYAKVEQLLSDVRAFGGNPLLNRKKGLFGKSAYAKLLSLLERNRADDGRIPLTFEIIYGHAFKPQATKLATGESIIRFKKNKKI